MADYQTRDSADWTAGMLVAAALVMIFWGLSFADPCLLGHFLGSGDPTMNPIAITECDHPGITNGDVIVRLGALALVSGLFACVCSLLDPARPKWSVTGITVAGLTIAGEIHLLLQSLVLGTTAGLLTFYFVAWLLCCAVASVAASLGAALGASVNSMPD